MKKTTACIISLLVSSVLYANNMTIELKQNDFVQGKLIQKAEQPLSLSIVFPDKSSRLLAKNVFGEQDFMFKSEQNGTATLSILGNGSTVSDQDFTLTIERHIPISAQIAPPKVIENTQLEELRQKVVKNPEKQTALINDFWDKVKQVGTPLIEPLDEQQSRVTFLWRGAKQNVRIWGGVSTEHDFMERFGETDLWYKSYVVPNDTLVEYRLSPDIPTLPVDEYTQRRALLATAQADPLNKIPYFEKIGQNLQNTDKFNYYSLVKLANAPTQPYLLEESNTAKGTMQELVFDSATLGNKRRLFAYLPANFSTENTYPVIYLFDGVEYTERVPTKTILDNMIAQKVIPPTVAVFIENPSSESRRIELPANPIFTKILAEEIVPFAEKSIGVKAKERIISGSSYGGLSSAYTALNYSHIFNKALILSGSFWWSPKNTPSENSHYIAHQFAIKEKLPVCFFISAGFYESGRANILETSRHLKDVLLAKGYPVTYMEQSTSHGYLAWQGLISDGLKALLGKEACQHSF
ncbi:short-chain isoprenyl diphosphate synthase [Mannheimia granulomatis]|uniref:Short-chain isoprenyl diphosphate synthase n=1 Tax=Mannheimia granulomatis TaxID=85402 RepID=A0A011NCA8_9PAST|nr:alpha/beta hydrolase-fold protein [Mannheimia granulomatis]EXI61995.1 short-chain isoprenyl diphosphate synthase [Mannheimia granulomatis]RGE49189.1 short-chain isoprenyl diphosphate synthase [Mannheimia granulomatis]